MKTCPKCKSENVTFFKSQNGMQCHNCGLRLGPFTSEKNFKIVYKRWEKGEIKG
jgi:transcription elongation factor Elf1